MIDVLVPVLNQRDSITASLEAVLAAKKKNPKTLNSIIVLDGGSVDGTDAILREKFTNSELNIFFRKEKMGIAVDFDFLVRKSEAEYCWFISADDVLTSFPSSAAFSEKLDLYFTQHYECNEDLQPLYFYPISIYSNDRTIPYCELAAHALNTETFLTFLSTPIFKREIWRGINDFEEVEWVVARNLLPSEENLKKPVGLLSKPYLLRRGGNDSFFETDPVGRIKFATERFPLMLSKNWQGKELLLKYHKSLNKEFTVKRALKMVLDRIKINRLQAFSLAKYLLIFFIRRLFMVR